MSTVTKSYRVYTNNGNTVVTATSKAAAKRAVGGTVWKVEEMTPESEAGRQETLDYLAELDRAVARKRAQEGL